MPMASNPRAFFLDPPLATVAAPGGEVYTAIDGDRVPTTLVFGRVTAAGVDRTYSDPSAGVTTCPASG